MKVKGSQTTLKTIDYLYNLAIKLPYKSLSSTKCKELLELSSKNLVKLKKVKHTICFKCNSILIPNFSSQSKFVRRESGFCFEITCKNCENIKNMVIRGY